MTDERTVLDDLEEIPITQEEWAIHLVRKGYFLFPCWPKTKAPAVSEGLNEASNDESVIRDWWRHNPNYNPAINLGMSGLVVYDFDKIAPFENQLPTFTVQTGRVPQNGICGIQMYYRGSAKTHSFGPDGGHHKIIDGRSNAVGEVRSRGAYVMAPGSIHPSGNTYKVILDLPLAESPEQNVEEVKSHQPATGTDEQEAIRDYVEGAFDLADVNYESAVRTDNGGFKWLVICPWAAEHTSGKDFDSSSAVIMQPSGMRLYCCKHSHCDGIRQWKELRAFMEEKVGHKLVFGDPKEIIPVLIDGRPINIPEPVVSSTPVVISSSIPGVSDALLAELCAPIPECSEESEIPEFDSSVIGQDNFFRRFVDLVSTGNGIPDQFAFAIAKAILGTRMDGLTKFANRSLRPNLYVALIGETGTGKSEAWRRALQIIRPKGSQSGHHSPSKMKLIDSFESGAGLKDYFFEEPASEPILCYIDEVEDLGIRTTATRQPEILTTLIQLKEGTVISRTKAGKPSRRKDDARLSMIMCGQEGPIFMRALAGRSKLGLWDRMYPDYARKGVVTGLHEISAEESINLLTELNSFDYDVTLNLSDAAKHLMAKFWGSLGNQNARWKNDFLLDAFFAAFARHSTDVSIEDAISAIRIARRQIIIRRVCFTSEVPDKTGYYLSLLKKITAMMETALAKGHPEGEVARSHRDFLTLTHAFRDNEEHLFKRAWDVYQPVYLRKVQVQRANGQLYDKYLPALHD